MPIPNAYFITFVNKKVVIHCPAPHCQNTYSNQEPFKTHLSDDHNITIDTQSEVEAFVIKKNNHGHPEYSCSKCDYSDPDKYFLSYHCIMNHNGPYPCPIDGCHSVLKRITTSRKEKFSPEDRIRIGMTAHLQHCHIENPHQSSQVKKLAKELIKIIRDNK